ncbi:hypothetical protein Tco_1516262, partial [Tanacetum coccineum]
MGASYILSGDCRNCIPFSLKALPRRVWGLPMVDSHTGNHLKDSFTPLETIRRCIAFDLSNVVQIIDHIKGLNRHAACIECYPPLDEELVRDTYGGEPSIDLIRSFLNLGRVGDWLTLSSRGSANVPKALTKPVTHFEDWK